MSSVNLLPKVSKNFKLELQSFRVLAVKCLLYLNGGYFWLVSWPAKSVKDKAKFVVAVISCTFHVLLHTCSEIARVARGACVMWQVSHTSLDSA